MTEQHSQDELLQPWREKIDALDEQIVRLLNERAQAAVEVGKVKNADHAPIYVPQRERAVINRVQAHNTGPLPASAIETIYREIISASIALERPLRVGYLGPAGSFSHLAARRFFGASVDYQPVVDIQHVFDEVERGCLDVGLVPIENSTGGGIRDTHDCFMQTGVKVCAEVLIHVHHNVVCQGDLDQAQRIYSHPEAFDQCRKWLAGHAPGADRRSVNSTALAAEKAAADASTAAISSSLAAELYDVPIVARNIEDNPQNITRFFVIGNIETRPCNEDKTAIMFTTAHKPGALAEVINVFARHGINLTHIDKRPSQQVNWEYYFFIDCEGHTAEPNMAAALDEAKQHCLHLTVLGSFPKAQRVLG
jgi:chorismate mutase/prephenate dehydratase